jgi:hypothetical protein
VPDPRGFPLHVSSGSFRGLTRAPPPNSFGRNMPAMIASSAHERCRHHRGARRPIPSHDHSGPRRRDVLAPDDLHWGDPAFAVGD